MDFSTEKRLKMMSQFDDRIGINFARDPNQFDVIIVGAGPSGASCAYNLKRFNPDASVLLIDKASFPRYKTCGGGISPEVMNYLDFDLSEVIDYSCTQAVLITNKKQLPFLIK